MAAVMASDSQILALSTMFTEDVFTFYGGTARFGEAVQVQMGRLFVVLLTICAYVIALRAPQSIFDLAVQYAFSGYAALSVLLIAALFWKRSTKVGSARRGRLDGVCRDLHITDTWCAGLARSDAGCSDHARRRRAHDRRVTVDATAVTGDAREILTSVLVGSGLVARRSAHAVALAEAGGSGLGSSGVRELGDSACGPSERGVPASAGRGDRRATSYGEVSP